MKRIVKSYDEFINESLTKTGTTNTNENIFNDLFGWNWKSAQKKFNNIKNQNNKWEVEEVFMDVFDASLTLPGIRKYVSKLTTEDMLHMIQQFIEYKGGGLVYDSKTKSLIFIQKEAADKKYPSDFTGGGAGNTRTHGGV